MSIPNLWVGADHIAPYASVGFATSISILSFLTLILSVSLVWYRLFGCCCHIPSSWVPVEDCPPDIQEPAYKFPVALRAVDTCCAVDLGLEDLGTPVVDTEIGL